MAGQSVREATFDVFREYGLTSMFANPGSTEIDFLADLPDDLRFVLGLHEGAVVGMATGFAIGRGAPALAILHTTAGLGNAVGALATARVNRAPLVVVVGQQDRRHLASEPFLAGKLRGLAGEYPVWIDEPVAPQDVPGAIARACHEAVTARGPALVIVPMDDWSADAVEPRGARRAGRGRARARRGPRRRRGGSPTSSPRAKSPTLVVGAGADDPDTWNALVALAERLSCPVWQEPFSARAGFPQDHPLFAGHLPADRPRLRATLAPYDAVLVVGGPAFRQYPFHPGPFVEPGTRVAVVSEDPAEVHRSAAELAVLAHPGPVVRRARAARARARRRAPGARRAARAAGAARRRASRSAPGTSSPPWPSACPRDAIVIEESPSNRPELLRAAARARAARLAQPRDGRARVRAPRRDRPAHGPPRPAGRRDRRRRLVALRDPVAVERRALPRRRAVRRPLERRLRDHGPARGAARRRGAVAGLRRRRRRPRARVRLPGADESRRTTSCSQTFDEVLPLSAAAPSRCSSRSPSPRTRASTP